VISDNRLDAPLQVIEAFQTNHRVCQYGMHLANPPLFFGQGTMPRDVEIRTTKQAGDSQCRPLAQTPSAAAADNFQRNGGLRPEAIRQGFL
jgi:hypothetical protein